MALAFPSRARNGGACSTSRACEERFGGSLFCVARHTARRGNAVGGGTTKRSERRLRAVRPLSGRPVCASYADIGRGDGNGGAWDEQGSQIGAPGLSGAVGAEYGEGFVEFSLSGDVQLDVETLNERLEVKGATRMRHSNLAPDEAYGLVFQWDGVLSDTKDLQRASWLQLADEEGFKWPEIERPFLYECTPERAITEVLYWTRDFAYARRLGWRLSEIYMDKFAEISEPLPGIREWLERVNNVGIPRALVSNMSRQAVSQALEQMGLGHIFDALVTAEDDMDTCASQLLSASIKLARPPKQCIAFTSTPMMITAAHNCTMKAVASVGTYKHYDLKHADVTCSDLRELTIINLRRLFASEGENFMDLKKERTEAMQSGMGTRIGTQGM